MPTFRWPHPPPEDSAERLDWRADLAFSPAHSGAIFIALTILRTALEDRSLRRDRPGYADFANRIRYRLVPGLW